MVPYDVLKAFECWALCACDDKCKFSEWVGETTICSLYDVPCKYDEDATSLRNFCVKYNFHEGTGEGEFKHKH